MSAPDLAVLDAEAASARAAALLAAAADGVPAIAAWTYAPPAVVLGSAQRVDAVDADACARAGLAVARRGTGGGAVLCDGGLLEVDLALPAGHPLAIADVTDAYRPIGEAWRAALADVGVAVALVDVAAARAQDDARRAAARLACWAGISPYEVLAADGRKLVGLAQRRRGGAVLHQCAVACAGDPARVAGFLAAPGGLRPALDRWLARTCALGALRPSLAEPSAAWAAVSARLAALVRT